MPILGSVIEGSVVGRVEIETLVSVADNPPVVWQQAECMECKRKFRTAELAEKHRDTTGHLIRELWDWTVH